MLRNADDIALQLGWPVAGQQMAITEEPRQKLTPDEVRITELLRNNQTLTLDELVRMSGMSMSKTASLLFNLEMNHVIRALPGHYYELCS